MLSLSFTLVFNPATVQIDALRDSAMSWHIPVAVESIRGIRLLVDAPRGSGVIPSIVRSIVRANPRIATMDALRFACVVRERAAGAGIDARFIAATLLQESAFDPNAISLAGAYGIAQFTPATASAGGFDPFDPDAAIAGATSLLARYVWYYSRQPHAGADPYALALAAYNAGPGTVRYYGGVPPYPETREYISDIDERLARLIAEQ